MITVKKLVKRFGLKTVLRGLDFEAQAGEFVALLGPNGAGKTTFLRILASLSRPSLGEVHIAGHKLPDDAAQVRARLGVVSHLPLLYGDLTAAEQDRAIRPASPARRKVVLATAIAETSLTIDGVRVVIDAGYMRVPRFSPRTGMQRLDTVRVTQASADQRRGRAGRLEPGVTDRG